MTETIAHITDIHLDESFPQEQGVDQRANWEIILQDLKKRDIQKVIFGGDIGDKSATDYFAKSLSDYQLSVSLGNHDRDENGVATMEAASASDLTFDFVALSDYRYIVLDSSMGHIAENEIQWLAEAVKTDKKLILAVHHPILPIPSYIDGKYALEGREEIQEILHQAKKEVTILCGHYHFEDDRSTGNIRQIVTPPASYSIEKSEELVLKTKLFGYRLLHISPQSIETDVIYLKHD